MASIVSTISTTLILSLAFGGQFVTPQSSCPDGGFITTCIYPGYNFTDSILGMYCLNNQVELFAYNWTSYSFPSSLPHPPRCGTRGL